MAKELDGQWPSGSSFWASVSGGCQGRFIRRVNLTFHIPAVFPLLWLFGSFLLFSGLRRLSADVQKENQNATSKPDTHLYDANPESITHLIAQEVTWSKRCAWAVAFFASICFIVLGIFKGVGM